MRKIKTILEQKGISPVIGVILLVAVTVALVSLATVIVFDIGSDISENTDATVQVSEKADGVEVSIIRNENVEEFRIEGPSGSTAIENIGESDSLNEGDGAYTVIAVLEDGSEEVIQSRTVSTDSNEDGETVSGEVTTNPSIEGSIVEAYENGERVDYTTTDSNGEYELIVSDVEKAEIVVNVERFEFTDEEGNDVTLSASDRSEASENVNFNFDVSESGQEVDIGGETITIVNKVENDVTKIGNVYQLQAINEDLSGDYKLIRNIDALKTESWDDEKGFEPIGEFNDEFTGSFDGQGYKIQDLTIDREDEIEVGLFGINEGIIENVGVVSVNINSEFSVGGLVGSNSFGIVSKSYSTGTVTGDEQVGGLVGVNNNGDITESYSSGGVDSEIVSGGLVGVNNNGDITESYATGSVTGDEQVGGLVGWVRRGEVNESYATGSVTGDEQIGGLIGQIGRDLSSADDDHILNDSYVIDDSELPGENKVIGEIVEGDGEGDVIIEQGETTLANDGNTFVEDIEQELIDEFVKTESEFQNENELEQLDFDETWNITDAYPILQWQE